LELICIFRAGLVDRRAQVLAQLVKVRLRLRIPLNLGLQLADLNVDARDGLFQLADPAAAGDQPGRLAQRPQAQQSIGAEALTAERDDGVSACISSANSLAASASPRRGLPSRPTPTA
jgi:hypothetical protein